MKKYIAFILILASTISCKKVLDVEQKMDVPNAEAIKSVKDLEAVLSGAYDGLQSSNVLGGNMVVFADLLADDAKVDETMLSNFGTREIYERASTVQIGLLRDMWRDAYATINRANNVIYVVDNNLLSGADFDLKKDQLKGEALFIRAVVHFEIMRFWALPYDVALQGGNSQPGIPYRTAPTFSGFVDLSMARNTVDDVYSKVIEDLKQAELLLTKTGVSKSIDRASASAATGYLARVYFFKGDYSNASSYSYKVIHSSIYSLNDSSNADGGKYLSVVFQTQGNSASREVIFQLVNIQADQSNSIAGNYSPSVGSPLIMPSMDFKQLFNNRNDRRRGKYIGADWWGNPTGVNKYVSSNPASNICILRLAEMHLIKVESDALANRIDSTTWDSYNRLKKRSIKGYVPESITNTQLLDSIRVEHRREMCFEGDRYHNLKRLKLPLRAGIPWNDHSVLFKIPQEEMSGNPLMEQNP